MGNMGSTTNLGRRTSTRHHHHPHPPHPEITSNRYIFAAATPYPPPPQYPTTPLPQQPYYQYPGYYPPPQPMPPQHPQDWGNQRYPFGHMIPPHLPPYVEHQKAVTIRNDVNIKKESLVIVEDEEHPGRFLVSFTFDATVSGSISVIFFAKEGEDCSLTPVKETLPPVTVQFQKGLGQKFKQPSGTGIDLSMCEEAELVKIGDTGVYPLAVKAEASLNNDDSSGTGNEQKGSTNSQITQAILEKEKGVYHVRVVKQILFVNGIRYELQEIYGIGNSVEDDFEGNDPGKECVICLSEPRDTTVLPCRHMCMCSECARVLRFQTNRCPICRQPVERLLEIKVNNSSKNDGTGE